MKKILLSWLAKNNDFIRSKESSSLEVNEKGTTFNYHNYFFKDYDKHILLSSEAKDDNRLIRLENALKIKYPDHVIEPRYMNLRDVINLEEISAKVEKLLLELKDYEIDIFISPGTPAMQTSWILAHMSLNLKSNLIQVREARFTPNKKKPEKIKVSLKRDTTTASIIIKETEVERSTKHFSNEGFLKTKSIEPLYDKAYKIAQAGEATVLIYGETGTGKEHLARYIHKNSYRKDKRFIAINCSAMNNQLLESRLFGYKQGAFTGADKDTQGLLQSAKGGTIFLDEIGDISPYMQQVLLRVLQEKEVTPIGGEPEIIDVRFIAATNKDLINLCKEEKYRWDLYYRLAVVDLEIPSLKERGTEEIKQLIHFFLKQKKKVYKKKKMLQIPITIMNTLLKYHFPGNIRELENLIERLYALSQNDAISKQDLPTRILADENENSLLMKDIEKKHIRYVLKRNNFNLSKTAGDIGMAINTLKSKIDKYQISIERQKI